MNKNYKVFRRIYIQGLINFKGDNDTRSNQCRKELRASDEPHSVKQLSSVNDNKEFKKARRVN